MVLPGGTSSAIQFGFAFLPEYTGQGYAIETAVATMAYAEASRLTGNSSAARRRARSLRRGHDDGDLPEHRERQRGQLSICMLHVRHHGRGPPGSTKSSAWATKTFGTDPGTTAPRLVLHHRN